MKEARLNELKQFENFSFVKGNLADKAVIESIFEQYKPEIVVNLVPHRKNDGRLPECYRSQLSLLPHRCQDS